jgi:hypothetical protein
MTDRTAVLVTGSRDWRDYGSIDRRLSIYPAGTILLHGACGKWLTDHLCWVGADMIADDLAPSSWMKWPLPYFADQGKSGGPKRNSCLVNLLSVLDRSGFACAVEAFPIGHSPGTRGCIEMAKAHAATTFSQPLVITITEGT